jgi:hypothetical protein
MRGIVGLHLTSVELIPVAAVGTVAGRGLNVHRGPPTLGGRPSCREGDPVGHHDGHGHHVGVEHVAFDAHRATASESEVDRCTAPA